MSKVGDGRVLAVGTEWLKPPIVTLHGRTAGLAIELPANADVGRYDLAQTSHRYHVDRWQTDEASGVVDLLQLSAREAVFSIELMAEREPLSGVVRVRRGIGPHCEPLPP